MVIETKDWEHTCGDGCWYTWGTDVFIDDVKVTSGDYRNIEAILLDVLKHLGHEVILKEEE